MKYPIFKFIANDPLMEAKYLCYIAKSIQKGFFQNGNFYVLPTLKKGNYNAVYFPDLLYSKAFWKEIAENTNCNYGGNFPPKAVNELAKKLLPISQKYDLKTYQTDWDARKGRFFELCQNVLGFETLLENISEIRVLRTPYGTAGTFYPEKRGKKYIVHITSRTDFPAGNLVRLLLLSFYTIAQKTGGEIGETTWFERKATVDFILAKTPFREICTSSPPSTQVNARLLSESRQYLEKLGFPSKYSLCLKKDSVFVGQTDLKTLFTPQETNLIKALVYKAGTLLSFDEAAEAVWQDKTDEKYSLYALAKLVESIRKKIKAAGINKDLLITARGQGYYVR